MVAYKFKLRCSEEDKLNLLPTRKNGNAYPRVDNNCGDDSGTVLSYGRCLCSFVLISPRKWFL